MIVVFDTETDGTPKKHLPLDHGDQPHIVEIAALLCENDGTERACFNMIVKPDGYVIEESEFTTGKHGIFHDIADRSGIPLLVAMSLLTNMWSCADVLVAHNLEFDSKIVDIAFARLRRASIFIRPPGRCTMRLATPVLNLPPTEKMRAKGMRGPKRPSLVEAHIGLLGCSFEGNHRAIDDARAAARVFFRLKELGHVAF